MPTPTTPDSARPGQVTYLICTTARSGSNLLCALLEQTGVAGMVWDPHVHYERLRVLVDVAADRRGASRRQLATAVARRFAASATPNGVTGFKLMWLHLQRLCRRRGWSEADVVAALPEGTRFIWLTREDRLRQAISWVRALQSMRWASDSPVHFSGRYSYDHAHIRALVGAIEEHERGWRRLFERAGLSALELSYERLVADEEAAVTRVLEHLRVPMPARLQMRAPRYRRQGDDLSEIWYRTYRQLESGSALVRRAHLALNLPRHVVTRLRSAARLRWREWEVTRAVRAADLAAPRPGAR